MEHLEALTRRLSLWTEGKIYKLQYEGQTIKGCLKAPDNPTNIAKISKKIQSPNEQRKCKWCFETIDKQNVKWNICAHVYLHFHYN